MLLQDTRGGGFSARQVRRRAQVVRVRNRGRQHLRARAGPSHPQTRARARAHAAGAEERAGGEGTYVSGARVCERVRYVSNESTAFSALSALEVSGGAARAVSWRVRNSRGGHSGGGGRRTHLTRTNWRTSSERASRSTPRSAAFASNAAHADSHRLPEFTSFTGAASSSSKPSSSRWSASETTGPTGATSPWCVRARLTAPSPRDSRPRLVPGIAPVWAACVAKCRAQISCSRPPRKKKPKRGSQKVKLLF